MNGLVDNWPDPGFFQQLEHHTTPDRWAVGETGTVLTKIRRDENRKYRLAVADGGYEPWPVVP